MGEVLAGSDGKSCFLSRTSTTISSSSLGGLGIFNPTETADMLFKMSRLPLMLLFKLSSAKLPMKWMHICVN